MRWRDGLLLGPFLAILAGEAVQILAPAPFARLAPYAMFTIAAVCIAAYLALERRSR